MDGINIDAINSMLESVATAPVEQAQPQAQPQQQYQQQGNKPPFHGNGGNGGNYKPAFNSGNRPPKDPNQPNIYTDENITPMPIDINALKNSLSYAVIAVDENPPAEISEVIFKIVEALKVKKYVYRYDGEINPSLARDVFMKQDLTITSTFQHFIPWVKGFEIEGVYPASKKPSTMAGQIAKFMSQYTKKDPNNPNNKQTLFGFSQVSGAVRNLMSNRVHLYLGKDCLTRLKFIILYSSCGTETKEEINYETTKRKAADVIKFANAAGIKVFNLAKPDGAKRLFEFITNGDTVASTPAPIANSNAPVITEFTGTPVVTAPEATDDNMPF